MRREGRQHGMVRCITVLPAPFNPQPTTGKIINLLDSPPMAELHAKVPFKPSNHSKFTGKCRKVRCLGCHHHPVSKSRDKAKGSYKLKSCDVVLNHRLASWRVVDSGRWAGYSGISASAILGNLDGDCWDQGGDDDDDDDDVTDVPEEIGFDCDVEEGIGGSGIGIGIVNGEEDDEMEFFHVGFIVEYLDGEDWCVVSEEM